MARAKAASARASGGRGRRPEPIQVIEIDEDGPGDDEDEDEDEAEDDELEAEQDEDVVEKVRQKLASVGGDSVLLMVSRLAPGRGPAFLGSIRIPVSDAGEYQEAVTREYGGSGDGSFRVQFRVSGQPVATKEFAAEGAPIKPARAPAPKVVEDEAEDEKPPAPPPTAAPTITQADVAKLIADALAEQRAMAETDRMRRENEELKARLARLENAPPQAPARAEATTAELVDKVFEKVGSLTSTVKKAEAESPEMRQMREQMNAIQEENKAMRKDALAKAEAENAERFRRLEKKLEEAAKKGAEKQEDPLDTIASTMAKSLALTNFADKLTKKAEEDDDGFLSGLLGVFRPTIQALTRSTLKKIQKQVEVAAKQQLTAAPQQGQIDRQEWTVWVSAILNNPALVADQEYVRSGAARFGPYLGRLIAITERTSLIEFARETLGEEMAAAFGGIKPEDMTRLIGAIGVLRGTVVQLSTQPPEEDEEDEADDEAGEDDDGDTGEDEDETPTAGPTVDAGPGSGTK